MNWFIGLLVYWFIGLLVYWFIGLLVYGFSEYINYFYIFDLIIPFLTVNFLINNSLTFSL